MYLYCPLAQSGLRELYKEKETEQTGRVNKQLVLFKTFRVFLIIIDQMGHNYSNKIDKMKLVNQLPH